MKKKLCLLAFLIFYSLGFSQEKSVVDSYVDYFTLPRETLFLHTNKTTYMPGEEIWFKVYAYDRKSQLTSKVTTNIQLSIFDADGKQIDTKLFKAKDGFAHGNIAIDSTFVTGSYFLKVATQWMKNFEEDDSFVKKINIINPKFDQKLAAVSTKEYDVQFLPEGGHLLADVKNVVAVKAIDDTGKGSRTSGIIVDSNGKEVVTFNSNFLGLGRFSFTPEVGQQYTAQVTLSNSKELEISLPESKAQGITVQVNNLNSRDVIIDLITNEASFETIKSQSYKLLIHKDGVTKIIPIQFASTLERIAIAKQDLFKGINTITLFDQNQNPVVERMFFNEAPIKTYAISLEKMQSDKDSTSFVIQTNLQDSIVMNTSISVLPKGTKSYDPNHNILSAFYLKPYLKGNIERPSYYFTKVNRKKRYELDLLLLTQGWSRYSWQNIFNNPPQMIYPFENGLTIKGNINQDVSQIESFVLYSTTSNQTRLVDFDANGRFTVENVFANNNEQLRFSSTNKKGKAKQPKMVAKILNLQHQKETIQTSDFEDYRSFYANLNSIPINFVSENEVLDEVVVSGRLSRVYDKKGPPFKGSVIKVTDSVAKTFANFAKIMDTEKFFVDQGPEMEITSIERIDAFTPRPIFLFLDGQLIRSEQRYAILSAPITQFEDIYVDYSYNAVYDPESMKVIPQAIIINAFSRITPFKSPILNKSSYAFLDVDYGFEPTKTFYTPRYINYEIESFKDYGVIHWEPNAILKKDFKTQLTLVETGLDQIDFYVEGITSNGDLISTIVSFQNNKKP